MRDIMSSMSQGRVGPLFDAMAEDVSWRWMGGQSVVPDV
jgi:hypothetical protein